LRETLFHIDEILFAPNFKKVVSTSQVGFAESEVPAYTLGELLRYD